MKGNGFTISVGVTYDDFENVTEYKKFMPFDEIKANPNGWDEEEVLTMYRDMKARAIKEVNK